MAEPISALEARPYDFIREVSTDTINFYVNELSGIYLPEEFRERHSELLDIQLWKPENRLDGKFGRYSLRTTAENAEDGPIGDILVIGTTIGLSGLDRDNLMDSLRHFSLSDKVIGILRERGQRAVGAFGVDFGKTNINLGKDGKVKSVVVAGSSIDFGRADAEGRQQTCSMFTQLLDSTIEVINGSPEPKKYERIIK